MSRILVVEDEQAIAEAVSYALRGVGYEVDCAADGETAVEAVRERPYDLMILDLLLPGRPGLEVCRTLREEHHDLPIVMLTARDDDRDRAIGFEIGADDYVTKPFSVAELVSRVRAQLRRRALDRDQRARLVTAGGLELDVAHHSATLDGEPLRLTVSEFRLVRLLASDPGRAFTREELAEHLWEGTGPGGDRRAIDVHVSNLRRKLEENPREPRRLVTVRGIGYSLLPV